MAKSTTDYTVLDRFLKKNPQGTWGEFCATVKDPGMSDMSFYMRRKRLNGGSTKKTAAPKGGSFLPEGFGLQLSKKELAKMEKTAGLMINNEDFSYIQCADHGIHIKDHQYYRLRKALIKAGLLKNVRTYARSTNSTPRRKNPMYLGIFSAETNGLPDKAKDLLKDFVESLCITHKLRLEVVEYADPAQIEVREVH